MADLDAPRHHRAERGDSGRWQPAGPPTWRFRIVARLVIAFVRLLRWRVTTTGLEHVPRDGGAVVTWNHHSHVDFLLTVWDIYRVLDRPVRFLAKREVWDSRLFGWVPRFAEAVPVDRGSNARGDEALSDAVAALRAGHLVLVAPEATICESFEQLPWRSGAVRMAQLAGVPLIPSVSWGSHRLVTTGHNFSPRRAWRIPVSVRFGAPVHVPRDASPRAVVEQVRGHVLELLDEVQRDYPDGAPAGAWWVPARLGGGAPRHEDVLAARRRPRRRRDPGDGRAAAS